MARKYLNLGDEGQCYVHCGVSRYERPDFAAELGKLEATLKVIDESLESVHDDAYSAQKTEALGKPGVPLTRTEIEPEDVTIN